MRLAKDKCLTYINGYDHPHIIAGQGTMGLEIVEQVNNNNLLYIYNLAHLFINSNPHTNRLIYPP